MIAAYLATHPAEPGADEVVAFAARPELELPRPWSELLPDLRARQHTTRTTLVEQLAKALGVDGAEPQVAGYVHELEAGLRSPLDVRPRVVAALAEILNVPRSLLEASRSLAAASPQATAAAFARMADAPSAEIGMVPPEPEPDSRVDDLFTGGPGG
jgi:transcriptional regulator with XRE-family HTH domain